MHSLLSPFKAPALTILGLVLGILLQAALFQQSAIASPLTDSVDNVRTLVKRYEGSPSGKIGDGGPDTSDYPSDDDIRAAYIAPSGPSVFFSGIGDSQVPYNFAQSLNNGAVILRGAFPKGYITQGKPKRSIQWFQDFLDRVSGIFADNASGDVYFVGKYDGSVDACRIWARIEYPTLLSNPNVNSITLVDYTNTANQKTYPGIKRKRMVLAQRDENGILQKRDDDFCFDWAGDREDPADPDSDPTVGIGYYPGNCGVHVQQYQKNEDDVNPNPNYRLDIIIKDDQHETVGELDFADAPGGQGVDVDSGLPLVLIVTTGNVDDDPVSFAYGGQSWDSNSAQCSTGAYDSGTRNMDCGFTC